MFISYPIMLVGLYQFYLRQEVSYQTLGRDSHRWILPSLRYFLIELSSWIHIYEFYLLWEISYRTLGRDSRRWILPFPRGFLLRTLDRDSRRWILPSPRGFLSDSWQGFTGEFYLLREVSYRTLSRDSVNSTFAKRFSYRTLGRDSHIWILPSPRGFLLRTW